MMLERYLDSEEFLRIPYSSNQFKINVDGKVVNRKGEIVAPSIDEEGNPVVEIFCWSGWKSYKVEILLALTFKPICLPCEYWSKLSVLYADNDRNNIHPSNLVWKFPVGLGPLKHPGFAYVPGFTRYCINKDGVLKEVLSGSILKPHNNKGYKTYSVLPDIGKKQSYLRHRMVCLAWLEYPSNVEKMDVNHLNGIRGSDNVLNLEWATRQRNCLHAYAMGLRNNNTPVSIRNVKTGDVTEFRFSQDAAAFLGLTHAMIPNRLKDPFGKVYHGFYQIKRTSDTRPWVEPSEEELALVGVGIPKSILSRNIFTGEVLEHACCTDAGRDLFKSADKGGGVYAYLNKKVSDYPLMGYDLKYVDDDSEWPVYSSEALEVFRQEVARGQHIKSRGYKVTDITCGESRILVYRDEVCEFLNIRHDALTKSLDKDRLILGKWKVESVLPKRGKRSHRSEMV